MDDRFINPYEKPSYLSADICRKYAKPGQWGVVAGFGAGGNVRGAIHDGLHLVAIENNAPPSTVPPSSICGVTSPAGTCRWSSPSPKSMLPGPW